MWRFPSRIQDAHPDWRLAINAFWLRPSCDISDAACRQNFMRALMRRKTVSLPCLESPGHESLLQKRAWHYPAKLDLKGDARGGEVIHRQTDLKSGGHARLRDEIHVRT